MLSTSLRKPYQFDISYRNDNKDPCERALNIPFSETMNSTITFSSHIIIHDIELVDITFDTVNDVVNVETESV